MLIIRLTLLFVFLQNCAVTAQILGEGWLITLPTTESPAALCRAFSTENAAEDCSFELVSPTLNAWLIRHPKLEKTLGIWLARRTDILQIQRNALVAMRSIDSIPNDPLFSNQWHHLNNGGPGAVMDADFDSDQAWDLGQGGLSASGDTIVVAVIDGGLAEHPDIAPNIWVNRGEVPNDGIDNDQNGFVDDVRGWNFFGNNNSISGTNIGHGTAVTALAAAKGNNGIGIAGVNWHVKVMFVAGGGDEARVLKSYDYILRSRKKYNSSFGQSGAFVVATNASFGIDGGQSADSPLWCAMYDSLGKAGILSVAATANDPVDVDIVGDIPTTCPSEYLIAVTSLTKQEVRAADAAWGPQNIDIAAYGAGVYTTDGASSYGIRSGTSFAAPQVSGAIALLYDSPCPNLVALSKASPTDAALLAKKQLLEAGTPVEDLQGLTLTAARLNLFTLLKNEQEGCAACPAPVITLVENIDDTKAKIHWVSAYPNNLASIRWKPQNAVLWQEIIGASSPALLSELSACTDYEVQIKIECQTGLSSDWSNSVLFSSVGCCAPPQSIQALFITKEGATFNWPSDGGASFVFRWRKQNSPWNEQSVGSPPLSLNIFEPCTEYEVQVAVACDGPIQYSPAHFFSTAGCGACLDLPYCTAKAESAADEWIAAVQIGTWTYTTPPAGPGYHNLTGFDAARPNLGLGESYAVWLNPGFLGSSTFKEYFRLYIDFNQDGDFDDPNELAFDPGFASEAAVSGSISVPLDAVPGLSRMRVLMRFSQSGNQVPVACSSFGFGQVEDYCVWLGSIPLATQNIDSELGIKVFPNPSKDFFSLEFKSKTAEKEIQVIDLMGRVILHQTIVGESNTIDASTWESGMYCLKVTIEDTISVLKLIKN
jgi:serine protease